jgi:hypothetical protein
LRNVASCGIDISHVDVMHTSCFQSLIHRLSQRLRVRIACDQHYHCPRPRPTKAQHQLYSLLEGHISTPTSGAMAAAQLCVAAKLQREEVPVQPQLAAANPFTVTSFNVLADGLAQDGDFVHVRSGCTPSMLAVGQLQTRALCVCCRPRPKSCSGSTGSHWSSKSCSRQTRTSYASKS